MEQLIRKVVISSFIVTVMFITIWIWADKRQKRFDAERDDLNKLSFENDNE
jgi:hypothetical protein